MVDIDKATGVNMPTDSGVLYGLIFSGVNDYIEIPKISGNYNIKKYDGVIQSLTVTSKVLKRSNKRGRFGLRKRAMEINVILCSYDFSQQAKAT